jgi:hypothetical protein
MTRKESEKAGWVWSLVGDAIGGHRVERPAATKRFPDGGVSDVAGVDEAQVLRAIEETEKTEAQLAANRALATQKAVQALQDEADALKRSAG